MSLSRQKKVLVLGSDLRSFLTVIRSLGRAGIQVHTTWSSGQSAALSSRFVFKNHELLHPKTKDLNWKRDLRELLTQEQFDLVVPTNDPSLIPLQENRSEFAEFPIYLLNPQAYEIAFDKAKCTELARELGISVANERILESVQDLDLLKEFRAPYILKPTRSYLSTHLHRKKYVALVHKLKEAEAKARAMLSHSQVLVQEYFEGTGVGVSFLAQDGRLLTAFQHLRLHESPTGGSSYRLSTKLNKDLVDATKKMVASLNYTGVGMMEFIFNSNSKRWIFLELNGRFWGSLPLAVAAGLDFPLMLFQMLREQREDFPKDYQTGISCRNLSRDFRWLTQTISSNRFDAYAQISLMAQLVLEMRFSLAKRSHSDTFVSDDMAPGWEQLKQIIGDLMAKLGSKLYLVLSRGFPLRDWQRYQFRRAFIKSQRILFVCKRNICRSPFAEYYAKRIMPNFKSFSSCGYYPEAKCSSPTMAVSIAGEFGVDLRQHRSQILSKELLEEACMVLTFDEKNRCTILQNHPWAKNKVHSLGSITKESSILIPDPYGEDEIEFRRVYERIKEALDFCSSFLSPETQRV